MREREWSRERETHTHTHIQIGRHTLTLLTTHSLTFTHTQDLHAQLKEKNSMIKQMKWRVKKLGGELPEKLKDMPDDDDWAW